MDNLERLQSFLPDYYREIAEMQEILKTEDVELQLTYDALNETINASFIRNTTEDTIKYWENQFKINLDSFLTLKDKQQEILTLMLGFTKLSCSKIEEIVFTKTTYRSTSYVHDSKIYIEYNDIGYPDNEGQEYIKNYIEQLKPAHLGFQVVFLFRKHIILKQYKHEYLKQYSHKEMRIKREDL